MVHVHFPTPLSLQNIDLIRQIIGRIKTNGLPFSGIFLGSKETLHVNNDVIRFSFYNLEALEEAQTCIDA